MGRNQLLVQFCLIMFAAVSFLMLQGTATAISNANSKVLAAAKGV